MLSKSRPLVALAVMVVVALTIGVAGPADAATPSSLWTKRLDTPTHGDDAGYAEAVSPDGKTLVVVGKAGTGANSDYLTVTYDAATGAKRWSRRYDGPAKTSDVAHAVAITPDGLTAVVTGRSEGVGSLTDTATVAYDLDTGARQWMRRYSSGGAQVDYGSAVAVASDPATPDKATVVVHGQSGDDYLTIAYDAKTGAKNWVRLHAGTYPWSSGAFVLGARSLVITPDGATAIVTGIVDNTTPDAFSKDIDTIAYDIATGDIVWSAPYDSGGWDDSFASVGISPDGATVVVAGSSDRFTATGFDAQIIAYDAATGTQQWSRRYTSAGDQLDAATSVTVTASAAIITGISSNATTGRDYNTIAFDLGSGATLWRNRADGSAHLEDDGLVVAATHDGATVVVTGQSTGDETGFDFLTIAYDAATGKQLWKQRYDGPAHADDLVAYSMLAISPDDTAVYVSGTSPGVGTGTDVVALAYPLPT